MDKKNASFQMFIVLLSFIAVDSGVQVTLYKYSRQTGRLRYLGHAQKPKLCCFSVKKTAYGISGRHHFHLVQFLASFTSIYFEILSYLVCGEKNQTSI